MESGHTGSSCDMLSTLSMLNVFIKTLKGWAWWPMFVIKALGKLRRGAAICSPSLGSRARPGLSVLKTEQEILMAHCLRAMVALGEDTGLVSSTHMPPSVTPVSEDTLREVKS